MVSLLDLPIEIITDIATYLRSRGLRPIFCPWPDFADPRRDVSSLMSLCATCSLLRDIVQPMIFRSMHIHYRNTGSEGTFKGAVDALHLRPSLAGNVKSLLLTAWPSGQNDPDEKDMWRARLPKLVLPMLALLFNVTTLHFWACTFVPAQNASHLGKLLLRYSSVTGEPALLPHLRAFYVSPSDGSEDCFVRIADFIPFFRHPRLSQVNVYSGTLLDILEPWKIEDSSQLPPGSVEISTLNLLGCFFDHKSARLLVEACKGLKSLSYSQLDGNLHHIDEALEIEYQSNLYARRQFYERFILNPQTFSTVLESCKDTLETLQMGFRDFDGGYMDAGFKFQGFQTFSRLTSLNIEAWQLESFRDLPATLKSLKVQFRYLSEKSLPSDIVEFLHIAEDPQKTQWPPLRSVILYSVIFYEHLDKDSLGEDALFSHQAMTNGKRMYHGEREASCCLVWSSGDVEFTLRDTMRHNGRGWCWSIVPNEASMFEK